MKPLKLYTRTTLLVSLILVSVLLAVMYFFVVKAREIELQEQEEQARILVLRLTNSLPEISTDLTEVRKNALAFRKLNNIRQIRIYDKTLINEILKDPDPSPEDIPEKVLSKLGNRDAVSTVFEIQENKKRLELVQAWAPLLDNNKLAGAVSITIQNKPFSDLSRRLIWLTIALLAVAIVSITSLLYILFSQIIYRPLDDLLKTMALAETGRLDVEAPVRDHDEFGQLATGFNKMLSQVRLMTDAQAKHQKQLEIEVNEATVELAERNTQLEDANAALFEIQRELTKYERLAAAGQLAAQFAHEVGTPLNLISGHVQLLSARTQDQRMQERLELIASQISRIEKIVRNMLDATRRPRPTLLPIDVNALLLRIIELTAPTLAAHEVELTLALDENVPLILGDHEQLQQVLINLINNSLDAMPTGGNLSFTTSLQGSQALITCRDNGFGVSAEIRDRIFDPLFTTKRRGRGSGLGLAVVDKIIREHEGTISLISEPGEGAAFLISLPLASVTAQTPQDPTSFTIEAPV